jgi:RNA polymerase sigma-B factor
MRSGPVAFDEGAIAPSVARFVETRDVALRNRIVEQLTPLVEGLARRFSGYAEPVEDLVSEGFIGLIHALDHFDPARGVKFSTYASHFIVGQIKHHLRDRGKIIREPAWFQEVSRRIAGAIDALQQEMGRQPTSEEIGRRINLTPEAVDEILAHRQSFQILPIDTGDSDDEDGFSGVDTDKIKSQHYVSLCLPIEDRIVLDRMMGRLRDMERRAIQLFFYQDLSQTEIARKLGISCNYSGHLIRSGLQKLRRSLQSEDLREAHLSANRPGEERSVVLDRASSLYSANYFQTRLQEEIARARYYRRSLAVVAVTVALPVDADAARRDELLAECGVAIRQCIRRADVPARTGETEFAVILPHTSSQAPMVAERLAQLLARTTGAPSRWGSAIWPIQGSSTAELWQHAHGCLQAVLLTDRLPIEGEVDVPLWSRDADNSERMIGELATDRRGRGRPRTGPR